MLKRFSYACIISKFPPISEESVVKMVGFLTSNAILLKRFSKL